EIESSLENRAVEGEQYKLLYRLINALGYQKREVAFCAMIEPEAKSLNESNNLINFFNKVKVNNIVTLGALPLNFFGVSDKRLSSVHGESFRFSHGEDVINLIPIFHPSYLLVNPNMKKRVWDDLQIIKK
ncbi:MAG: hypothetical protein CME61_03365, partial [Halobacteriovoraceae bacterium]|nr:hypothetical protein [Halobacteriovoraceae bacterium]